MVMARQMALRAKLTLTIEVTSSGHWGPEATGKEVMEIGERETLNKLQNLFAQNGVTIVGKPKVGLQIWTGADET